MFGFGKKSDDDMPPVYEQPIVERSFPIIDQDAVPSAVEEDLMLDYALGDRGDIPEQLADMGWYYGLDGWVKYA